MAGLFQVLWGQPDGTLKEAAVLEGTDGEPLIIPADEQTITENICTRPMAVDWDSDGDLDLVVGNFAGSFYVFTGEGEGKFLPEPEKIMVGDEPLKISGAHSDPFPVDWDDDGDIDLLSGSSNGGVLWAENVADDGEEPVFDSFRELIQPGKQVRYGEPINDKELTGPTSSTRVWADDVNSDGKLDVLVGDSVMLVSLPAGLSEEELKEKQTQWEEKIAKVSEEFSAAGDDEDKRTELSQKLQELYAERSEFVIEDRTGFVWLYLQR
jgi:hypothetical protein